MQRLRTALPALKLWPFDQKIAAIARSMGNCTVVSADSDLGAVPGLAVENWAS
jgi:hypothetical protein